MRKVLVIEDNRDNLLLITITLEQAGYTVVSAETGEEGMDLAMRENPNFIILDLTLPGIDGIETIKRIRGAGAGRKIPIILITSNTMRGDRERILGSGCDGYFEKPIDPVTIVEKIHDIIGISQ